MVRLINLNYEVLLTNVFSKPLQTKQNRKNYENNIHTSNTLFTLTTFQELKRTKVPVLFPHSVKPTPSQTTHKPDPLKCSI